MHAALDHSTVKLGPRQKSWSKAQQLEQKEIVMMMKFPIKDKSH